MMTITPNVMIIPLLSLDARCCIVEVSIGRGQFLGVFTMAGGSATANNNKKQQQNQRGDRGASGPRVEVPHGIEPRKLAGRRHFISTDVIAVHGC